MSNRVQLTGMTEKEFAAYVLYSNEKITDCGMVVDEETFLAEWKSYYKNHTSGDCEFMTERAIFTARIQMFYDMKKEL